LALLDAPDIAAPMPTLTATCPFCGLLCDDLTVESDGVALRPLRGACQRSEVAFAQLGTRSAAAATARVSGQPVTHAAALDAAAQLLRTRRRPLIGGLGTDVSGMRATLALARAVGAVVDHAGSGAKYRNLHVLQEFGWITTTLTEARNRADLMLLIGDGWHTRFPRFVERVLAPAPDLYGSSARRRAILLDEASAAAAAALPQACERLVVGAPMAHLPALLATLCAQVTGQPVGLDRLAGVAPSLLARCLEWMRAARYGVAVWAAADLDFAHAELALQALSRLLRSLNAQQRFAGLPLAGSNGDLTTNAVHTWQSGASYPASHANGQVDFDPHRYAAQRVLARGEADCLLWISSLTDEAPAPDFAGPVIVLGRADLRCQREPDVFVPVATAGVDADGHLLRTDKVVSLYLRRLRSSTLPSVAQAVAGILQRLAA
jgi:formylmethanofuran dehydrogenase subunit B